MMTDANNFVTSSMEDQIVLLLRSTGGPRSTTDLAKGCRAAAASDIAQACSNLANMGQIIKITKDMWCFNPKAGSATDNGLEELDSELDSFLAEIDDIEQSKAEELPEEPNLIIWRECVDEATKHPYYWHTESQQVTWVKPETYDRDLVAQESAMRQWKKKCEEIKKANEERKRVAEEKKKLAELQPKPSAPRKNPRIELESDTNGKKAVEDPAGSFGKIGKFNFMKSEAEQKVASAAKGGARLTFTVKKTPDEPEPSVPLPEKLPEPPRKRPKVTVPTHTASGKQRTVTEIAAEIKKKKQQIALTNARIHLQKRVEEQKLSKKLLENAATKTEEIKEVKSRTREEKPVSPQLESKKRRIFQEVKVVPANKEVDKDIKRAVEKEALLLKEKLEFLGGDLVRLSKFQVHIIALETRISDFIDGHLSVSYVQGKITELGQMLRAHEENSVPKDWTCSFDRDEKRYRYTNKMSGKSQFTHPGEDDDKSSSASSDSEPEKEEEEQDKDDDLYELFQQEIKVIEETARPREGTPDTSSTMSESTPEKMPSSPTPPPPVPAAVPPIPPNLPPTPPLNNMPPTPPIPPPIDGPPPPFPGSPGFYNMDPWTPYNMMMGHVYPDAMGGAPPPPPPDDGMMDTYSPGNSDSEEDEDKKKEDETKKEEEIKDKDLGVVSVKAPMRYSTQPTDTPGTPEAPGTPGTPETPQQERKVDTSRAGSQPAEDGENRTKKFVKKKKKHETVGLTGTNKKNKNMSNLVAKWNKVNKNADVAMK